MTDPESRVPERMPFWGVGPLIGVPAAFYGLAALAATLAWPSVFAIPLPYPYLAVAGGVLLALGVAWYAAAVRTVGKAYREKRLVTGGVYAFCRHPVYAAWALLILPGLGLLADSWLVLSTAAVMYVLARVFIRREETDLEARFGGRYLDYKRRTHAIFPALPRRR